MSAGRGAWVVPAAIASFLLLAFAFRKDLTGWGAPKDEIPPLKLEYSDPAPVRKLRTQMTFDGTPCQSCHDGSEPLQGNPKEKGVFHEAIKLQHGRNQHCFNCHHRVQPGDFANFDNTQITLQNIELLCARCHGTTYRDWKAGAHGRRNGHWDKTRGPQKTVVCIACHEPHWPAFKALEAAPAPHVNPRTPKKKAQDAGGHHG